MGGIVVVVAVFVGEVAGRETMSAEVADDGGLVCDDDMEDRAESCAVMIVASSIEMPTVISGCAAPPFGMSLPAAAAGNSSIITSSSSVTASPQVVFACG